MATAGNSSPLTDGASYEAVLFDRLLPSPTNPRPSIWVGVSAAEVSPLGGAGTGVTAAEAAPGGRGGTGVTAAADGEEQR